MRWTDVAHELGYHDQMYMIHDFRNFSDSTPAAIARQLEMFTHPALGATSEPAERC